MTRALFHSIILFLGSFVYATLAWQGIGFCVAFEQIPLTQNPSIDARLVELLKGGDATRAESLLSAVIEKEPKNWQAHVSLAYLYAKKGQYPTAQLLLKRAKEIVPHHPTTLAELGHLYLQWGSQKGISPPPPADALRHAKTLLTQAHQQDPHNSQILLYLAELALVKDNDTIEAKRLVKEALALEPSSIPAVLMSARLFQRMQMPEQARYYLLYAYDLAPQNPMVMEAMAMMMAQVERPEEAIRYAEDATLYDVADSPVRMRLIAEQYEKLADPQKALEAYAGLASYFPKSPDLALKKAQLTAQAYGRDKAHHAFKEAVALNPQWIPQRLEEAKRLIRQEALEAAKAPLQEVLHLEPMHPELLALLSGLYYRQMLLGQTIPPEELASVQRLFNTANVERPKLDLQQGASEFKTASLPDWQTLDRLKLKITKQDGWLLPEDCKRLYDLQQSGASIAIRAESAFLLGNMSLALALVQKMPPSQSTEEAETLGHRWRLMQFIPGAIKAFQWAYTKESSPERRRWVAELEQVNQQIENRLSALRNEFILEASRFKKQKVQFQEGLRNLQQEANMALEMNPCHPLAWQALAEVAELQGNWGRAVLLWQEAQMRYTLADGSWWVKVADRIKQAQYQAQKENPPSLKSLYQNHTRPVPASMDYTF